MLRLRRYSSNNVLLKSYTSFGSIAFFISHLALLFLFSAKVRAVKIEVFFIMKKLFTVLPLVLATSAAMAYEQGKTYQFTILHTNDTHGHFLAECKR